MKFNKQLSNGVLMIPSGMFKISGFESGEKVELHTLDSAVVVLKQQMTAMELIQAVDTLHKLTADLTVHLAHVCGPCEGCEKACPFDDLGDGMLELPDYLREEAGIPAKAKLDAVVNVDDHTVTLCEADYDHDLRDVPEGLLEVLDDLGVCMGELEKRLIAGDIIYNGRAVHDEKGESGE